MKPHMPESVTRPVIRSFIFSFAGFVLGAGMAQNAFANPSGATVVHGSAQFATPNINILEITNSANAIINWQSFNIGQGELTRFIQPSADSAVLNRVTGVNASDLLGNLSSNGHVFLINPHGIVIGENAVIDVAGFVASTLNLSNEDFLNQRFNFQGENAGALINRGFITAGPGGEIVLIAPQIENHGALSVDDGALLLAAGEKVTLTRFDLNGIEFEVQAPDNSVINLGELIARRGAVGVFAGSIDHGGVIEANSLGVDVGGNIVLQARDAITIDSGARVAANGGGGGDIRIQSFVGDTLVRGDVEAVGHDGNGGSIQILGERVGLTEQANIDVSGTNGGGEILVGGDYRGLNAEIQNASATFVGEDVRLAADATVNGDGGRVIVWADEATRMYGSISAKGGSEAGDGGFIETSGKQYLQVGNNVPDVSAINGNAGEWLLDPRNITIQSALGNIDGQSPNFLPILDDSTITASVISAALTGGATVTIDTNSPSGMQEGDVTFSAPINAAGEGTLNVRADGDIFVNAGITANASGPLNIDFISNRDQGDGFGGIQVISTINTNNGNARFISRGDLVGGASEGVIMNNAAGAVNVGTGEIFIQAQTGPISLTGGTESALQSDNRVTLETDDGFIFSFGAISNTSLGNTPVAELRSFSSDVELGTNPGGGLLINDALLAPINANSLIIASAAGRDVLVEQQLVTLTTDTTINSGRDMIFNNSSANGLFADDVSLSLNAAGSIVGNTSGTLFDVDATSIGTLSVQAVNGIQLNTHVSNLQYSNTGTGNVDIINHLIGNLNLLDSSHGSAGTTTIDHLNGSLFVAGNVMHSGGTLNLVASGVSQMFALSSGSITNNGDIVIAADSIDILSGTINASVGGKTILKPFNSRSWLLGGTSGDLTEAELNSVLNNIAIGGSSPTLAGANIVEPITFSNNQNLTIETSGTILFNQNGSGIANAGLVHLIADSVANGSMGADITANRLIIDTANGIGTLVNPLETRVNELVATNTVSGDIGISNTTANLRIYAPGVRNSAGDVTIFNAGGSMLIDGLIDSSTGNVALRTTGTGSDIIATTDIVAASNVTLSAGRDLIVHAGPGPTTQARVRAGNTLNLGVGRNLALISDTAGNAAAIVSNSTSLGTQNGIELQAGDMLLVGGATTAGLLRMSGGSATFNGATSLSGLVLTGGVLDGAGDVTVSGPTTWRGGGMGGTGATTINGAFVIDGAVALNRNLNNVGSATWQGAGDINGGGVFNNLAGAVFTIANDRTMSVMYSNAGITDKIGTGLTSFSAGYRQTAGMTRLDGGTLQIAEGEFLLAGGVLTGIGTVMTPRLNQTGGLIAPGSFVDAATFGSPAQFGTLVIDGDLQMSGDARIVMDLGISTERGGVAGTDFDLLEITGDAALNGNLVLIADPNSFDAFVGESFKPILRYGSSNGAFSAVNGLPPGYAFSPIAETREFGVNLTAVPLRDTDLIPDDELERLRDEFRENIARIKMERQRRRQEDEEEEKRRRAMMCS